MCPRRSFGVRMVSGLYVFVSEALVVVVSIGVAFVVAVVVLALT